MSKSVWYIFMFGALGALILSMFMCMSLDQFQQSPASKTTKLAQSIRREFNLQSAGTVVRHEGPKRVLRVIYQTTKDSKFDISAQNAEMEKIAAFAYKNHESRRKREIELIRVTRHEVRGSGCFQRTYTASHEIEPPEDDPAVDFMRRMRRQQGADR